MELDVSKAAGSPCVLHCSLCHVNTELYFKMLFPHVHQIDIDKKTTKNISFSLKTVSQGFFQRTTTQEENKSSHLKQHMSISCRKSSVNRGCDLHGQKTTSAGRGNLLMYKYQTLMLATDTELKNSLKKPVKLAHLQVEEG